MSAVRTDDNPFLLGMSCAGAAVSTEPVQAVPGSQMPADRTAERMAVLLHLPENHHALPGERLLFFQGVCRRSLDEVLDFMKGKADL